MSIARDVLVSIVAVVVVAALGKTSFGHEPPAEEHHGSHEGHEGHHKAHHKAHPEGHHEAHHEAHHEPHPDAHHEAHHDPHHDDQYAKHDHNPWHPWHRATANELTSWFGGWGWTNPVYYEYGPAGNVVYQNETVYPNGSLAGTAGLAAGNIATLPVNLRSNLANVAGESTKTASEPASVNPSSASSNDGTNWLPLGTFAMSRQGDGIKPTQTLQLAVNKSGAISGVLSDSAKNTSVPIQGSVDRATQRANFTLENKSGLVAETGIYNLTRDKATLLMHHGSEKPQRYSLTRLQSPSTDTHDHLHSGKRTGK